MNHCRHNIILIINEVVEAHSPLNVLNQIHYTSNEVSF